MEGGRKGREGNELISIQIVVGFIAGEWREGGREGKGITHNQIRTLGSKDHIVRWPKLCDFLITSP